MDTGKLPPYRSSYLLRFHPYPRVKPSTRERVMASAQEDEQLQLDSLYQENEISFTLVHAIHGGGVLNEAQSQRQSSMSSLVIDLAFLLTKKLPLEEK